MSAQIYRDPRAIERMRDGKCPECGAVVDLHGGWGGPGCALTDYGVAARIDQQEEIDAARVTK